LHAGCGGDNRFVCKIAVTTAAAVTTAMLLHCDALDMYVCQTIGTLPTVPMKKSWNKAMMRQGRARAARAARAAKLVAVPVVAGSNKGGKGGSK